MNLCDLRSYILRSQFFAEETVRENGLSRNYTISQILAIILERTLDVGWKLEALADLDIDVMFETAKLREIELDNWVDS